ncbi:MAG: hypothetical protein HKP58_08730, partial [Desulfatitalea sp.]|nr:hypothetical protein [Desulfatitalea sp.]NNK00483.1 hypothetical protein [Desulfatitalea sp.]
QQGINGAMVTAKLGNSDWGLTASNSNGHFEIADIPQASDYMLLFQVPGSEYVNRIYVGETQANLNGNSFDDIGEVPLSEATTVSFSVYDEETGSFVSGLVFHGYSYLSGCDTTPQYTYPYPYSTGVSSCGNNSLIRDYSHESIYDSVRGTYSIVLPNNLEVSLVADIDLDDDGKGDWRNATGGAYVNGDQLVVTAPFVPGLTSLVLKSASVGYQDIQLRLSLVDAGLDAIAGQRFTISDTINGLITSTYDAITQQYVLQAKIDNNLSVLLPAFTIAGEEFSSASVNISRQSNGRFQVNISGTDSNSSYFVPDTSQVLDIALKAKPMQSSSLLELVTMSDSADPVDNSVKFFYSAPIGLDIDSIHLTQQDVLEVVRGDDSSSDLVLPGTTWIDGVDSELPTTSVLSLNDTLLTVTPDAALVESHQYEFYVAQITDINSGLSTDLGDDAVTVTVPSTQSFNINDLRLDNNSYTTGGALIHAQNTAGAAASAVDADRAVYLVLPDTIETLAEFSLTVRIVTEDGVAANSNSSSSVITIVADGRPDYATDKRYIVSLAANENVVGNAASRTYRGMSSVLSDGRYFTRSTSQYISDNTGSNVNTIEFEFAYETKSGQIQAGTITLPVL